VSTDRWFWKRCGCSCFSTARKFHNCSNTLFPHANETKRRWRRFQSPYFKPNPSTKIIFSFYADVRGRHRRAQDSDLKYRYIYIDNREKQKINERNLGGTRFRYTKKTESRLLQDHHHHHKICVGLELDAMGGRISWDASLRFQIEF